MTTIETGYRKTGKGTTPRGLSRVRFIGTLKVIEDGRTLYAYSSPVSRLSPDDALFDARKEAESLIAQNPGVELVVI